MPAHIWEREIAEVYDATSAAMFDPIVLDPCVEFLASLTSDGAALEFAIGTGRVALPLSQRGVSVSGIELSPDMIDQMKAKRGSDQIPMAMGDITTTRVAGSFKLVYIVWNAIPNVTTQDEQLAVVANAAAIWIKVGTSWSKSWFPSCVASLRENWDGSSPSKRTT